MNADELYAEFAALIIHARRIGDSFYRRDRRNEIVAIYDRITQSSIIERLVDDQNFWAATRKINQ